MLCKFKEAQSKHCSPLPSSAQPHLECSGSTTTFLKALKVDKSPAFRTDLQRLQIFLSDDKFLMLSFHSVPLIGTHGNHFPVNDPLVPA